MKVTNVMEIVVEKVLEEYWIDFDMTCKCEKCKVDAYAIALNKVHPRYIVNEDCAAFVKAEYLDKQSQTNILVIISSAAKYVSDHPRCGIENS